MRPVYVRGLGLWTPGFASPTAWCRGEPDPEAEAPAATMLTGPLKRRASKLTRMGVEVFAQAIESGGCDAASIPSVWATAHGEHSTAMSLLGMMRRGTGKVSPTQFHNSVHNTPGGYASIAAANCAPSVTLTGGGELVVATLLEALCQLEASGGDIALVLADEMLQPPFDRSDVLAPLAIAFCLSSSPASAQAQLTGLRRDVVAPLKADGPFAGLYISAALPLLERVALGRPGTVALEFEGDAAGAVWCVDCELAEPSREGS